MFSLFTLLISLCYIVISVHSVTSVKTYQRLGERENNIYIQLMITLLLDDHLRPTNKSDQNRRVLMSSSTIEYMHVVLLGTTKSDNTLDTS